MQNRRGQSTAEYAIVISVVIAAVVGMQLYVKRGMQAKFKSSMDSYTSVHGNVGTGSSGTLNTTNQYEPYYTAATTGGPMTTVTNNSQHIQERTGGLITKTINGELTSRNGNQTQGVTRTDDSVWR